MIRNYIYLSAKIKTTSVLIPVSHLKKKKNKLGIDKKRFKILLIFRALLLCSMTSTHGFFEMVLFSLLSDKMIKRYLVPQLSDKGLLSQLPHAHSFHWPLFLLVLF